MEQLEFFSIPNPCKGVCQTNLRGLCLGCFRNRDERFQWKGLQPMEQQNILRLAKQRRLRFIRQQRQLVKQDQAENPLQNELLFKEADE